MATIYTTLNGALDPLRARVFADGLEVIVGSKLRPCTTYQWQHDARLGDGFVDVSGAISETYTVPTSNIDNSGDYRCITTIGSENDNLPNCPIVNTSDVFTVSIIECVGTTAPNYPSTGGTESIAANHPHYETPVISVDATWVTQGATATCDTQTAGTCETIVELIAGPIVGGMARVGYANIAFGELVCSFALAQDYPDFADAVETPAGPDRTPVIGPNVRIMDNSSPVQLVPLSFLPLFPPVAYGTVSAVAFFNPAETVTLDRFTWQWTVDGVNIENIPTIPPRTDATTPAGLNAEVRLDDVLFNNDMEVQQTLSIADGVAGTLDIGVTITDTITGLTSTINTPFVIGSVAPPVQVPIGIHTGDTGGAVSCSNILGQPGNTSNTGSFTVTQGTISWSALFRSTSLVYPNTPTGASQATGRFTLTGVVDENGQALNISGTLDDANPGSSGRFFDADGNDRLTRLPVGSYTATIELLTCGTGTGINRDPSNISVLAFNNIGSFSLF